ncbi:Lsr2 family DNA-binding protein [Streptomyces lucensis]|uniref:Lsr2 family DNA-binding protein n=1 Tax=Streptomyces lucensis TaxID=67319 RepID=UPI001E306B47|nr:histone-like nucleoid-structuring protein Lsr2 [Streptomyces lucensis]
MNWASVESDLQLRLPEDYKQLTAAYDPGCFANFLWVYDPRHTSVHVNLLGPARDRTRAQIQDDYARESCPAPVDPQFLLPCGGTDNGEDFFLITDPEDDPDAWTIIVNQARGPGRYTFDGNLTRFLVAVFSGSTTVPQFPEGLLQGDISFKPSDLDQWSPPLPPVTPPVSTDEIRIWARANGYEVPVRGRIPADVRQAWEQADESH